MTYTDEEVATLREKCTNTTGKFYTHIDFGRGIALLDRLEAAEVIAEDHASIYPTDPAVIRWRKAKGK